MEKLRSFLSNDSVFGQLMYRAGIIIGVNLLFILCSIPVFTIGASCTAMYTVCLKMLRERSKGNIRIIPTFFRAFKSNFIQATLGFLGMVALAAFLFLEITWCNQFTPPVSYFRFPLLVLLLFLGVIAIHFFPVLAAFNGTLRQQLTNTLYFSFTRPLHLIPVLFVHIFPLALSYVNLQILPLTAFLWASFGFGAIAMYCSTFHLKAFRPFLGRVDAAGDPVAKGQENDPNLILSEHDESEERTLAEMRKFGL